MKDTAVTPQFADIETVFQNVRKRCPVKAGLAFTIDMALGVELVREAFEGVLTGGIDLKDTLERLAFLRVQNDWLVFVVHVEGEETWQ